MIQPFDVFLKHQPFQNPQMLFQNKTNVIFRSLVSLRIVVSQSIHSQKRCKVHVVIRVSRCNKW